MLGKIDHHGNYTPFPGCSIISHAKSASTDLCHSLYSALKKSDLILQTYALLPPESYHVTALNLFTQQDCESNGRDWHNFISQNLELLREIDSAFQKQNLTIALSVKSVFVSSVIQVFFHMPEWQEKIISGIASKFGLSHMLPSQPHMTLAYQFCRLRLEANDTKHEVTQLKRDIISVFQNNGLHQIDFPPPRMHYFKDMTEFTAWDASSIPAEMRLQDNVQESGCFAMLFGTRNKGNPKNIKEEAKFDI